MRRAAAIAAALALAGCQVDLEGARCNTPGEPKECPDGQACGNDLKCSTRAAGCVASKTLCTPAATQEASPRRCRTDRAAIETCTGADPVCGSWAVVKQADGCSTTGLVCSGASPACVCDTPATEIQVDLASSSDPNLAPTGAAEPQACRFKRLGDALAYARDVWLPAHSSAPVTVKAAGTPAPGTPVRFDTEAFPLVIPNGVTLATSATVSSPADWIVSAPFATVSNLVEIHDGAVVDGFTLSSTAATGDGIVVQCGAGATAPATLRNVVVDGGGTLARGVVVTGACELVGVQLDVSRARKAGLYVNTASAPAGAAVTGGSLKGNGESGAEVAGGRLAIAGSGALFDVSANGRHGVRAVPDPVAPPLIPRAITLSLDRVDVHANGEVGILVRDLAGGSSASVTSSVIRKNLATAAFSQYGTGRLAGGVLLWGALPTQGAPPAAAFAFKGNTVCSNAGDAIGVYSNDPWPLNGDGCDATSNVFVSPSASGYYVFSTATTGVELPAWNNWWDPDPVPPSRVMNAAVLPVCGQAGAAPPACN